MPRAVNIFDQQVLENADSYSRMTSGLFTPNLAVNSFRGSNKVGFGIPKDIITNGLQLYCDAAIPNSFPRGSNTWFDLTGNGLHGTLFANSLGTLFPTWSPDFGGVINVTRSSTTDGCRVDWAGFNYANVNAWTVFCATRYTQNAGGRRLLQGRNNNWLLGHWVAYTENYFSEGWVSPVGNGPSDTQWRIYAATGRFTYNLYINGNFRLSSTNGQFGPNGFCFGGGVAFPEPSEGQCAFVMLYNRVLSAEDIFRQTNVMRGRLGV
jgi:hypothetical protein